MRTILSCAAMAAMMLLAWSADGATATQKKKTPAKKSAAKKGAPAKSGTAAAGKKGTTTTASSRNGKEATAPRGVTWRNRQTAPTPDRYKEIQGALAAKGFLTPEEATGSWDQASTEALKKFQTEQNLEASGKINSLSLIALGLGPRRDVPPPPAQ